MLSLGKDPTHNMRRGQSAQEEHLAKLKYFHGPRGATQVPPHVCLHTFYIQRRVNQQRQINKVELDRFQKWPVVKRAQNDGDGYKLATAVEVSGVKLQVTNSPTYVPGLPLSDISYFAKNELHLKSGHLYIHVFIPTPSLRPGTSIPYLINLLLVSRPSRHSDSYAHLKNRAPALRSAHMPPAWRARRDGRTKPMDLAGGGLQNGAFDE